MIIGYARVGTDDQRLDSQTDALSAADTNKIFADKIGGSKRVRPELNKMPDQLREVRPSGDVPERSPGDRYDDVCSASPLMGTATSLSDTEDRGNKPLGLSA